MDMVWLFIYLTGQTTKYKTDLSQIHKKSWKNFWRQHSFDISLDRSFCLLSGSCVCHKFYWLGVYSECSQVPTVYRVNGKQLPA